MSESKIIFNQLLGVQQEVEAIKRDSLNPYFKSKYFDVNSLLAELKPVLNKHNLVVIQPLTNIDGKSAIKTVIMAEDGSSIEDIILLPVCDDPQKMGAIITYYRRYTLQSLFLLEAEDDDAESAVIHRPMPSIAAQVKPAMPATAGQPATPAATGQLKKTCETCGNEFEPAPGREWAKLCMPCFKAGTAAVKKVATRTIVNPDAPPFPDHPEN